MVFQQIICRLWTHSLPPPHRKRTWTRAHCLFSKFFEFRSLTNWLVSQSVWNTARFIMWLLCMRRKSEVALRSIRMWKSDNNLYRLIIVNWDVYECVCGFRTASSCIERLSRRQNQKIAFETSVGICAICLRVCYASNLFMLCVSMFVCFCNCIQNFTLINACFKLNLHWILCFMFYTFGTKYIFRFKVHPFNYGTEFIKI